MALEIFDREHLARCGHCGNDVMTLADFPIIVAACSVCDAWTLYRQNRKPEVIQSMVNWGSLVKPRPTDAVTH